MRELQGLTTCIIGCVGFQYANRNVRKLCSIHTCIRTCIRTVHIYMHVHAHVHNRDEHINTFKATKDIAAGQEIFIRYGSAQWFECKNIPRADVDYASTMWRPDLHPLPCRQSVSHTTGADGRHSFAVREAVSSGTILEVSLCLELSVVVVDQFPFLWDFVLTGEMRMSILVDCCH